MHKPCRGLMSYCFCTGTALYRSLNYIINYSINKLIALKLWKSMIEMLENCKSELN